MTNLAEQLKQGAGQAWESLAEGWRELGARASGALTRFWAEGDSSSPPTEGRSSTACPEPERRFSSARWSFMAVDIYGSNDKIVVRIEAHGMAREDFQIEMNSAVRLSVLGRKPDDRERSHSHYALIQCAYGTFRRDIELPVEVDVERAKASYDAGVLRIELPRRDLASRRRITVQPA